jgi:UPF0716 family protein affecting phage T7 exclusion
MLLIILVLSVAGIAGGVYLMVVTARRYGFHEASRNLASRPGAMLAGGVLLLIAGFVAGTMSTLIMLAASHTRQTVEEELTKMFGRPPDRLELEGAGLGSARGAPYYGTKRYQIDTSSGEELQKDGEQWKRYTITAKPLDEQPGGAGGEPGRPRPKE